MTDNSTELDKWVERIVDRDMPVFGRTARQLAMLVDDEGRHRSNLIQVVLHDVGLTARVLRLANSAFYNHGNRKMSTVSRAVLVLGVNGIRNICLSIALIDSLLKGQNKEIVAREMGKAFYAAVVAKEVAERHGDPQPEEVFVAALLYRLGEISFRCFGESKVKELDFAISLQNGDRAAAERKVLGFKLTDLTRELAKRWQLGELLEQSLLPEGQQPKRCQSIVLAQRLADAVSEGLDTPQSRLLLKELSDFAGTSLKSVEALVRNASGAAEGRAREYGANSVAAHVPRFIDEKGTSVTAVAVTPVEADTEEEEEAAEVEIVKPDPLLQLRVLRELTSAVYEHADFHQILEIVLEGMYRGIGMDLVVFALLTIDRARLKAKFALGADSVRISERMDLEARSDSHNVFSEAIESKHSRWVALGEGGVTPAQIGKPVIELFGSSNFFLAPALVTGRVIGVFYADRRASGRPLDAESFESFKHFALQAEMALDVLARKK